jgi:sec-independent protein translocase protein TatA
MPGWIGPWELIILVVVALLVFGPKRLPEIGRSLGAGMREFKDSVTGRGAGSGTPPELPPANQSAAPAAPDAAEKSREPTVSASR